jgi:hypothetical protein
MEAMGPRDGVCDSGKARGWRAADQARPAALVAALLLAGCGNRLAELDPRPAFANIFGAHLEGREPPPGLDRPWPHLSSVPARPTPPDPALRDRISAGLAADREQSRAPMAPTGGAPVPAGAVPPPPRLAGAPPIRFDPAPDAQRLPAALSTPAPVTAPRGQPAAPAAAPEPFAPPPAPSRDLLAPPPPPSRDLLAPRRD